MSLKSPKIRHTVAEEMTHGSVNDDRLDRSYGGKRKLATREGASEDDLQDNFQWRQIFWDEERLKQNSISYTIAGEFLEKLPDGSYVYIFNYGDEDGEYYSQMEHNNIFRQLPKVHVSKH